jgi:hypothetical protein
MAVLVRRRKALLLFAAIALGVSVAAVVSEASDTPGCGGVSAPIAESKQFTPVGERLTAPLDPLINPTGESGATVPPDAQVDSIDGLPLRYAVVGSAGSVYQYFMRAILEPDLTLSEFLESGGIEYDRDSLGSDQPFQEYLLDSLGERAVAVEVGQFQAVLVWADPLVNGTRPHHVYWSDAEYNYALIADTSPEHLVDLARGLVCA